MNTEQKILKLISENKGKARVHTVAKYLKFENGYVEYLYKQLLKRGLIKKIKEKGQYKITRKGRKEIGEEIKPSKTTTNRKKRIKKQEKKNRKKIRKPIESLIPPTTEAKAKAKEEKKGIIEVFKKLFARTSKKTK